MFLVIVNCACILKYPIDIDECDTPGICGQLCTNTIGGFYCSCTVGYQLINGRNCTGKFFKVHAYKYNIYTVCFIQCNIQVDNTSLFLL